MTAPAFGAVPDPPATPADHPVEVILGHLVADPHRALEYGDSDAVRAWDDAQSARTETVIAGLPGRGERRARLRELLDRPVVAAASVAGGMAFTLERDAGADQPTLRWRRLTAEAAAATVLVDPVKLFDEPTAAIDWYHPSPDGRLVAFGISSGGDELSTLRIVEVDTGRLLGDEITRTRAASVAWTSDASSFTYTRYPDPATVPDGEAGYHRIVRSHTIGADPADDPVVWDHLPDPTAWPEVRRSADDRWLLIHVAVGWDRTDVHLHDRTSDTWATVISDVEAQNDFRMIDDHLVGVTTLDAPRGRVVIAPLASPTSEHWVDLVSEGPATIDGFAATAGSILVARTRHSASELARITRPDAGWSTSAASPDGPREPESVPLPADGTITSLAANRDADEALVGFTSFASPAHLLRWSGDAPLVHWAPALPDADADHPELVTERHRYPSTDGTEVTLFTLRRSDNVPDPETPTILTGYGGFGLSNTPVYSAESVAFAEEGGVWALACIRGGAEEGAEWHRAGQRANKPQVFADFEAAADWLVAQGRTSPKRLAIKGGSNGGLLVTAVLTRRPEICAAVHSAVPLCDMVRFPRFRIARLWVPEYGDPDQPADLAWLLSYSPYHRVADGVAYPAVMLTTGADDSRVDPLHARKMAARLQAASSGGPVLLRVERDAGHGQGKPTSRRADESADVLTFLTAALGD